jgi:phosphohistidine phosphatase
MIWLLRHAEAEDGHPDESRRLTPKGEEQSRAAGAALAALGIEFDLCITSPRVRAEQTARLACESLGVEVITDERLSAGPFDARELAAGLREVLLVGHDPDFSMAVHELTGAQVRMKKGGIAAIDRGELRVLLRPQDLAVIAGSKLPS